MAGEERKTAHAPYNFVPLPAQVVAAESIPDHDQYHADRHTGYFDVKLTTETPLYIRGMLTEREAAAREQHKNKPDFFQVGGKPIIPGSSLRGMIRSLVEIISFSKIQPVTDRKLIYRAVGDTTSYGRCYREMMLGPEKNGIFDYPSRKLHGGYLERNGHEWAIRPAKRVNNESFVFVPVEVIQKAGISIKPQSVVDVWVQSASQRNHHQVQKNVFINLAASTTISQTNTDGLEQGKLVISGQAPNRKRYPVIFAPDHDQPLIPIQPELWELYEADRDLNRGIATRPLYQVGDPLFYLVVKLHN
jgi:CRISPR-associated protein (TIGR03986 family)